MRGSPAKLARSNVIPSRGARQGKAPACQQFEVYAIRRPHQSFRRRIPGFCKWQNHASRPSMVGPRQRSLAQYPSGLARPPACRRVAKPEAYSSIPAGSRPARNKIMGASSKSPSSASPVRDHAITPSFVNASRSAVRQAVCADLQATAGSARRRVPRPTRNDCTMNCVSCAIFTNPRTRQSTNLRPARSFVRTSTLPAAVVDKFRDF